MTHITDLQQGSPNESGLSPVRADRVLYQSFLHIVFFTGTVRLPFCVYSWLSRPWSRGPSARSGDSRLILVVLEFVIVLIIVLVGRLADSLVCYEYKDGSNTYHAIMGP